MLNSLGVANLYVDEHLCRCGLERKGKTYDGTNPIGKSKRLN